MSALGLIHDELRLPLTPLSPQYHDVVRTALVDAGTARSQGIRTMKRVTNLRYPAVAMLTFGAILLAGCETIGPVGKRIDYKSTSAAPALELPPELSQPRFDDRSACRQPPVWPLPMPRGRGCPTCCRPIPTPASRAPAMSAG